MCYAGGPYCPKVATKALDAAKQELTDYLGDDDHIVTALRNNLKTATLDYMMTTEGIKELKEKATKTKDPDDQEKLEIVEGLRKEKIAQSKAQETHDGIVTKVDVAPFREPIMAPYQNLMSVDYDYDGRVCAGDIDDEHSDGYCRDSTYENIRVSKDIDYRETVSELMRINPEDIPPEMLRIAKDELHLDRTESYEILVERGYYGEEASVVLSDWQKVRDGLQRYCYSRPDAVDKDGVLPYLRGKGLNTTNKTPLDALKESLRKENNGKVVAYVEKTKEVYQKKIRLEDVVIPQKQHYKSITASKSIAPENAPVINGIVVYKAGKYHLVDGYHRVKGLQESKRANGQFIVME